MHNPDLGEDQTWACVETRSGHVSIADEKKFGSCDSEMVISADVDQSLVLVKGKQTYKIKEEIKSYSKDDRVVQTLFSPEAKCWTIKVDNHEDLHAMVINVRTFLHACCVLHAKDIYEKKVASLQDARKIKREIREANKRMETLNAAGAAFRPQRFEALKRWRAIHSDSFKRAFFDASWHWYNAAEESSSTRCSSCDFDMLNYYGSDEHPFKDDEKPNQAFLENCHHCGHHFFNNWN